jgi:3-oxoacyl-[acyl-carrier-protein] synthase-3
VIDTPRAYIRGIGSYLPEKVLTNKDIEKLVETNDAWIVERTGISERRIAAPEEATSDLGFRAAQKALTMAGIAASDLDMILFATCSPDTMLPNTACILQQRLGAGTCVSWDLNAACSGFVFGASVANQYIRTGMYKNILVVGAEVLSRIVNYKDRETCILFGDGAGAAVFSRTEASTRRGILAEHLSADGSLGDLLTQPSSGSRLPVSAATIEQNQHLIHMRGREIFKNAVRTMARGATEVLKSASLSMDAVKWVIPHQANQRIIEAVAKQLEIPMEKIIMNLGRTGNTSAASVPIALDEAISSGVVKEGDLILISVFGAGLTSGALLVRY